MCTYKIVRCPYCKGILAVKLHQKTKTCTYCGKKFKVPPLRALALARNSEEAGWLVKYLKAKEAKAEKFLYHRKNRLEGNTG